MPIDPPLYPGVYLEEIPDSPSPIAGVSTSVAAFVGISRTGPVCQATRISSFPEYQAQFGDLDSQSEMSFAVYQFFLNGGTVCWAVSAGATLDRQSAEAALRALDNVPVLNLLCLPGVIDGAVLAAAAAYVEKRRAFFIVDPDPSATTPDRLANLMQGSSLPRTASAAIYGPWLEIADPANGGNLRNVAPSGSVAGLYARFDGVAGPWKAPAGISATILGARGLAFSISDRDGEALNELGFNLLRPLPGNGIAVWGARTLGGSATPQPEFTYVPMRRFALFLEGSIASGTQWAVFEPNAEPLWSKIRMQVSTFLQQLFERGAFQGASPAQAWFVKCDSNTTTQNDIDAGMLNIIVGFAPLRPAEFVVVEIQQFLGDPRPFPPR